MNKSLNIVIDSFSRHSLSQVIMREIYNEETITLMVIPDKSSPGSGINKTLIQQHSKLECLSLAVTFTQSNIRSLPEHSPQEAPH